ncbi:carbohydrate ABC transporter permease [Devosia ginsengisoli]|uniref:carbohydrate ABC transporter permease n=1 Tax=Devosia ginsengisoli TaxID=400770 RepID=UPI0026F1DA3E|nr:carbohydrate ABC transporter permease [Devosia ginsengisoli]MCR6671291.1 carbohydrate ABC transporter permease [Devosia ginsengisoli]
MRRATVQKMVNVIVSVIVTVIVLFPILWGLSTSLKSTDRILKVPPDVVPNPPVLDHYYSIFERGLGRYLFNTVVVSSITVLVVLLLGFMAAYALARMEFRAKRAITTGLLIIMSIPLASLLVPTFTLLANLNLLDTRTGLVLLYTTYELPLTIWLISNYIKTIPESFEHAALIDGYSRGAVMRKVTLPLAMPVVIASSLFTLTFAWNDFIVAVTMNASEGIKTLPVGIYNFLGIFSREWGPLTAAAMISIIPIVIIFVVFQRYFVSGLTGGGAKG